MDAPHITVFSTPLVSTWLFDETHRILFDAGDGCSALLDSKIHKSRIVALTHAHRDHCAGLMQLLNLRGGAGDFRVIAPEASGALRGLSAFLSQFDSRTSSKVTWVPCSPADEIPVEPDRHFLRAFATDHYAEVGEGRHLSLGYTLVRLVDKLKPEFVGMGQVELDQVRAQLGREHITFTVEDHLLAVSGDTVPIAADNYRGARCLLHECTFLNAEDAAESGHRHSMLSEVLDLAQSAGVGRLGLYHISKRYEDQEIVAAVRAECAEQQVSFPVSVALPGRVVHSIFASSVWQGTREFS